MNWMRSAWGRWSPGRLFSLFHKTTRCCFMCLIYRIYLTERVLSRVSPPFGFPAWGNVCALRVLQLVSSTCAVMLFLPQEELKVRLISRLGRYQDMLLLQPTLFTPILTANPVTSFLIYTRSRKGFSILFMIFFPPFTLMVLDYWAYFCVCPRVSCQGQLGRTSLFNTKQALRTFLFRPVDSLIRPTNPNHHAKNIRSVIQAVIINTPEVMLGVFGTDSLEWDECQTGKGDAHVKEWLRQKQTSTLNSYLERNGQNREH